MKKEKQNVVLNKNCHSRVSLSGISTALNNAQGADPRTLRAASSSGMTSKNHRHADENQHLQRLPFCNATTNNVRGRFQIKFGMTPLLDKCAFTLIELLVVVLIIGILAAVALPQYQKAVVKSRLAQWDVMFNAGKKGANFYLLENGLPESGTTVYLTGKNSVNSIQMPGNCDTDNYCYTSAGALYVYCNVNECAIQIIGPLNADGSLGNKALGEDPNMVGYSITNQHPGSFTSGLGKIGCQWIASHSDIPANSMVSATCGGFGITLPNPAI